jgi:hypothetical protein
VISKVFTVQRAYEAEISEGKHRLKMQAMRLEEQEALRFDLEIL